MKFRVATRKTKLKDKHKLDPSLKKLLLSICNSDRMTYTEKRDLIKSVLRQTNDK